MTRGSVLVLGTFDGVHKGHQTLLKKAVALARRERLVPTVLTFEKPPRFFFSPPTEPSLLTLPVEKKERLHRLGIERVVLLRLERPLKSHRSIFLGSLQKSFVVGKPPP